jgi:hypothetical protein
MSVVLLLCALLPIISADAQRDEATVAANWTFNDGSAKDRSKKGLNGNIVGDPKAVDGIAGKALKFNGEDDGIKIPDSADINTGGPYTNRTVAALFYCDDVKINDRKQVIYEEGGRTRGLVIYVHDGKIYGGGWNRAQYNWNGAWPSADVKSKRWYHVGIVIRDAAGKVESKKFEMWLDGKRIAQEKGGQLHKHGSDIGIGHLNQSTAYHDGGGGGTNIDWFAGLIDEVIVYGSAFDEGDFSKLARPLSVEPQGKFTTTWAHLKAQRTEK